MDPVLSEANHKIDASLQHLQKELAAIRAGRAHPSLIEDLPVMAYGTRMKMVEVGTIGAPQPSLLTIQVWDQSVVKDVEKAILESNLGLNPSVDGNVIRLPLPALTEERRTEFVKLAHQKGEEAKIHIRQVRSEQRDNWKSEADNGDFGEDELDRREKILQTLIDKAASQVDEYVKAKETDLMEI